MKHCDLTKCLLIHVICDVFLLLKRPTAIQYSPRLVALTSIARKIFTLFSTLLSITIKPKIPISRALNSNETMIFMLLLV